MGRWRGGRQAEQSGQPKRNANPAPRGVGIDRPQLRFVQHDQVIETFAPNGADEPLDVAVLPGRARRRG
jgi:hypothetical protein